MIEYGDRQFHKIQVEKLSSRTRPAENELLIQQLTESFFFDPIEEGDRSLEECYVNAVVIVDKMNMSNDPRASRIGARIAFPDRLTADDKDIETVDITTLELDLHELKGMSNTIASLVSESDRPVSSSTLTRLLDTSRNMVYVSVNQANKTLRTQGYEMRATRRGYLIFPVDKEQTQPQANTEFATIYDASSSGPTIDTEVFINQTDTGSNTENTRLDNEKKGFDDISVSGDAVEVDMEFEKTVAETYSNTASSTQTNEPRGKLQKGKSKDRLVSPKKPAVKRNVKVFSSLHGETEPGIFERITDKHLYIIALWMHEHYDDLSNLKDGPELPLPNKTALVNAFEVFADSYIDEMSDHSDISSQEREKHDLEVTLQNMQKHLRENPDISWERMNEIISQYPAAAQPVLHYMRSLFNSSNADQILQQVLTKKSHVMV
ncbi:MAG TPA: hypothetical protein VK338_06210 [Candidatus Nitrosocosmicus sp.]|nr:hypothetical protein [Candidatus Nitrosocosmicus sp.]